MNRQDLERCMREGIEHFLRDLDGQEPHELHALFLAVAEKPLLEVVMRHADGNQSRAAQWLGINRNTLRRKLSEHQIPT